MKVSTNILSGSFINEASQSAEQLVGEVTKFVSTANHSADDIRKKAANVVSSTWNSLYEPLTTS